MKANTPQSALRAVICRHGFGGAHTQRSPEREQKRARRQSAFPEPPSPARPREGPSRRCPGGRGEPGAESGEIAPCTPQALPQSTRGRRGSPRGYAWWQGDAGLPVPRRTARPSRPRGWHRPQPPGEESWGSEFTLSPSPPLPPAGTGAMAPRPACGGPAVSLLWSLGAVEQLPLLGPRPVLQAGIPLPSEEMRRQRGCVSERKAGESGEQSGGPACGRKRGWGVTGLRPGCTTPCPASPLTRVPGSPAPCRPARSAGSGDSPPRAPLPTPPPPSPARGWLYLARGHGGPAAASQPKFDRGRCGDKNNRR